MRGKPSWARRDKVWGVVVLLATREQINSGRLSRAGGGHMRRQRQLKAIQRRPRPRRAPPPETIQEVDLSRIQASRRS